MIEAVNTKINQINFEVNGLLTFYLNLRILVVGLLKFLSFNL